MWLSDLRLVLPDRVLRRGSIRIEGDRIAEIIEGPAPQPYISSPGLTAIPGIIDLHGDMLERNVEPRPQARFPVELALYELDKQLAAAGITTAYAAISFAWKQDDIRSQESANEIIHTVNRCRADLLVDMRVHARFEVTNPSTIPVLRELLQWGMAQLVSIMDHTPGQGQYGNLDRYIAFMTKWLGGSDDFLTEAMREQLKSNMLDGAAKGRDWDVIREVVALAAAQGIPVASHDDDTGEKVKRQAQMGIALSEFPVSLEAAQEARDQGMWIIMGAPNAYRGGSNTGNLSALEGIERGLVDILASDYFPAAMLHAAFAIADKGLLPLHESVKLITKNPADALGLHDRGRIEVGAKADFALLSESVHHRVRGAIRDGLPIYWDAYMSLMEKSPLARQMER